MPIKAFCEGAIFPVADNQRHPTMHQKNKLKCLLHCFVMVRVVQGAASDAIQ